MHGGDYSPQGNYAKDKAEHGACALSDAILCGGAQCVPFWLAWKECLCGKEGKRLAAACPRRAGAVQARAAKSMRESATPQQPGEVDARGVACALWGVCAL